MASKKSDAPSRRLIQKMERKPPVEFTAARKEQFLKVFRETGLLYRSAEVVGVHERTVQEHVKSDPVFAEEYETAKQCWVDEVLVGEAVRRAAKGVLKPIIGGKDRDEVVAHENVYSDQLMSLLLKSRRGEYRDGAGAGEGGGGSGGVLIVPMAPQTMDDWEQAFGEMARGQSGSEELDVEDEA